MSVTIIYTILWKELELTSNERVLPLGTTRSESAPGHAGSDFAGRGRLVPVHRATLHVLISRGTSQLAVRGSRNSVPTSRLVVRA